MISKMLSSRFIAMAAVMAFSFVVVSASHAEDGWPGGVGGKWPPGVSTNEIVKQELICSGAGTWTEIIEKNFNERLKEFSEGKSTVRVIPNSLVVTGNSLCALVKYSERLLE